MLDKRLNVGDEVWHGVFELSENGIKLRALKDLKLFTVVEVQRLCMKHIITLEEVPSQTVTKKLERRLLYYYEQFDKTWLYNLGDMCPGFLVLEDDETKAKEEWNKIIDDGLLVIAFNRARLEEIGDNLNKMETKLEELKK